MKYLVTWAGLPNESAAGVDKVIGIPRGAIVSKARGAHAAIDALIKDHGMQGEQVLVLTGSAEYTQVLMRNTNGDYIGRFCAIPINEVQILEAM